MVVCDRILLINLILILNNSLNFSKKCNILYHMCMACMLLAHEWLYENCDSRAEMHIQHITFDRQ